MPDIRPVAVSTVAFDGVPRPLALAAIAAAGATHAEPAFISGTMVFTEDDLSTAAAASWRADLSSAGLGCVAVSGHMDAGADDALERLSRRIRFAASLGAKFLITNTARGDRRDGFLRTAEAALRVAEQAGVAIAFENPGHGEADLLRAAADWAPLRAALGSPQAVLNYDVGNTLTNSEGALRPETDLRQALPLAAHLHLKDMVRDADEWRYQALGQGSLDYDAILSLVAGHPDLPVCIELPLRQQRRVGFAPTRRETAPEPGAVRAMVEASVARVRAAL